MSDYSLALVSETGKSGVPGFKPNFPAVAHSDLMLGLDMDSAKQAKMMNAARAPGKQLFMTAFMLWMSGSGMNIFTIMMTGMALWTPLSTIFSIGRVFEPYQDMPQQKIFYAKATFIFLNGVGLSMGVYKLGNMGLLPLYSADWMHMLSVVPPAEVSAGGMMFSV